MPTALQRHPFLTLSLFLVPTAVWGVLFSVGKLLSAELPPFTATLARYGVAALVLVPLAWRDLRALKLREVPFLILLGGLGGILFNGFVFVGLRMAPAGDAVLAPATVPLITTLMSSLWLGLRPGRERIASLGVSVLGLGVVLSSALNAQAGIARGVGDLMHLGAAVAWSAYLLLNARVASRYAPRLLAAMTALVGGLGALPIAWLEGGLPRFASLSLAGWLEVGYLSLIGSVVAFMLWGAGIRQMGAAKAATFMNLVPLWGLAGSIAILHESLGWMQLAGIILVLLGVFGGSLPTRVRPVPMNKRATAA
ncbi:MAG TPA: DMT family transporter [Pantanalinema sp.]